MSSALLAKLLARTGKSAVAADARPRNPVFAREGVKESQELRRIVALPRRQWSGEGADPLYASLSSDLTEYLRSPYGEMTLRPIQAAVLYEAHDFGGAFSTARVGAGKTIISLLAPTVLESVRPLLLVPAKLREKTKREIETLSGHWRIGRIRIESYEMLGRVSGADMLEGYQPDLIVSDEAHKLKNTKAAVTRRVRRYMNEHPDTKFIALSGTITKRSLHDYAHILKWCLKNHPPIPRTFPELVEWADAIDQNTDAFRRVSPGALVVLMDESEKQKLGGTTEEATSALRSAFRRRLIETPGVVATTERQIDCSLVIAAVEPAYNDATEDAFGMLRELWETPDGHPIADAFELWRHARELACGFFYRWDPYPPDSWLVPRRIWCKFVREILKTSRELDSELQVAQRHSDAPEYLAWKRVRDTFKPHTVPVWIDDGPLNYAAEWAASNVGIVWIEHRAFGEKLSKRTGVPYFGAGGKCGRIAIDAADVTKPVLASVASNSEGRNLQGWSKNLVVSAPPPGILWEQMLGRTHRDGQIADEVTVDVMMGCIEQWLGFQKALEDARYLQESLGQEQKLLYADKLIASEAEVAARREARWNK